RADTGAVRGAGLPTRRGAHTIVRDTVAVIVAAVADFGCDDAAVRTYTALVDRPVAVVILTVAGLGDRTMGDGTAALRHSLVASAFPVVVQTVARLARVVAEPGRRIELLRRRGAGQQRAVPLGIRGRDRRQVGIEAI